MTVATPSRPPGSPPGIVSAAERPGRDVLRALGATPDFGLSEDEVVRRQARYGPNAVSSHRARLLPVLWHQLRSPLLGLLLAAALASYFVGEQRRRGHHRGDRRRCRSDSGFVNEYRAEKAAEALHSADPPPDARRPRRAADARSTSPRSCPATWSSCSSATSCRPTSGCSR